MPDKKRIWFTIASLVFWSLVAMLNLSQTYLSSYVRGWEFKWSEQFIYASGWLLWAAYTPIIIYAVRRIPLAERSYGTVILKNAVIGLGFASLHCLLEIVGQYVLWSLLFDQGAEISQFYGAFFYKFHVNFFIYLFVAGSAYVIDYFRKSKALEIERSQLESQLTQAQLASLKMQLHPHFLFNTHHAIIGLLLKNENKKAAKMLTRLSDLLRITLESNGQQMATIKKEIEVLEVYLDLHKMRFGDRLKVDMQVDDQVGDYIIPNLLLQPLVENAIKHGIAKDSTASLITIEIRLKQDQLHICVADDGPGAIEPVSYGVGLQNTASRLGQLYPEQFEMRITNRKPKGFQVDITIPASSKNAIAHEH
ncbi:MAG: histidine kinase [Bacteroidota bacterium]